MRFLAIAALAVLLLPSSFAHAVTICASPNDDGICGQQCVGIDQLPGTAPDVTTVVHVWADMGSIDTVPASAKCSGGGWTSLGDETCMVDILLNFSANLEARSISNVAADSVFTTVYPATSVRLNTGDPFVGLTGLVRVADIEVFATGTGNMTHDGVMSVGTDLGGVPEGGGTVFAFADFDTDEDGICDPDDPCPNYLNTTTNDADQDGIFDDCQCGDTNGDGKVNAIDIGNLALAANNMIPCNECQDSTGLPCGAGGAACTSNQACNLDAECTQAGSTGCGNPECSELWDTNNTGGQINAIDIGGGANKANNNLSPGVSLNCQRRPTATLP